MSFLSPVLQDLPGNNTHLRENSILTFSKGSVPSLHSLSIQRTWQLQQHQNFWGSMPNFIPNCMFMLLLFSLEDSHRYFWLILCVETCISSILKTKFQLVSHACDRIMRILKKKKRILEWLCLIAKIVKNIIWCALSTCQSLWNVKVIIALGGAIACQGAVMENFVGSHFFWSLSFFSVLHLVLVIGFPWLSLEAVCIWPKFSVGYQFHICYNVVQSLLFWHPDDINPFFS